MDLIEHLTEDPQAQSLLRYAQQVDTLDRILGPLASTLQLTGDPLAQIVSVVLEITEICALKLPFVIKYLRATKDYEALVQWVPKEIFSNGVPYGDVIDVMNSYKNRTRQFYEKQIIKEGRKEYNTEIT